MSDRSIVDSIRQLAGTHLIDSVGMIYAEVVSVDEDKYTCECEAIGGDAQTSIINVALMAGVNDGFLLVPKIGSAVVLIMSKRYQPFIAQYSEIERIEMHGTAIELNDGSNGGLVKVIELTQKLNALENLLNDLILKYNTHVHAANGTPTASIEETVIVLTQQQEIENTTVTHGI